jgi:hypothetical protein
MASVVAGSLALALLVLIVVVRPWTLTDLEAGPDLDGEWQELDGERSGTEADQLDQLDKALPVA